MFKRGPFNVPQPVELSKNDYKQLQSILSKAPIRDRNGGVVAAMSAAGPATRMDPITDKITMEVIESAVQTSKRMGYRTKTA